MSRDRSLFSELFTISSIVANMIIRRIGYDLNCTLAKLEKLTECELLEHVTCVCLYFGSAVLFPPSFSLIFPVARGKQLFGDPAFEIQELTQVIKEDIAKLNSDIAALQQLTRSQAHGRGGKHLKTHSGAVVISLQVCKEDPRHIYKISMPPTCYSILSLC